MELLFGIIKTAIILGVLIFIHEGGHFLAARLFKVKVEDFSIGFGPKLWEKQGKETKYIISAIPFGGFLKMYGEEGKELGDDAFNSKPVWQRFIIVAAGATVNVLFGLILYFMLASITGTNMSTNVSAILPESTTFLESKIEVGDKILQVNDYKIRIKNDLGRAMESVKGEEVKIVLERNDEIKTVYIEPTPFGESYIIGIQVALAKDSPFSDRMYYSFWETIGFIGDMFHNMGLLFSGDLGIDKLAGPIGISSAVADSSGLYDFIYLFAFISVSLGITNFLPIPALDGGKLILLIIEGIRRKPISENVENAIQSAGFLLLIGLALLVSCNDLIRLLKELIK